MLALIAGQGELPVYLADRLRSRGEDFRVYSLDGFEIDRKSGITPKIFRLETLGSFLDDLAEAGTRSVCFAGAISRPELNPALVDAQTIPLLGQIKDALKGGDDAALRAVISMFSGRGFTVRGADEIAPDLLPPAGAQTRKHPEEMHIRGLAAAHRALEEMAKADLGQACIVADGKVIAREGKEGTAALLRGYAGASHQGAYLFKAPKPGQERRADLPVIGPETAKDVVAAGLDGLIIEAGGVMVLDRRQVCRILDDNGRFLWVEGQG